jgi:DNA repair protein RadC
VAQNVSKEMLVSSLVECSAPLSLQAQPQLWVRGPRRAMRVASPVEVLMAAEAVLRAQLQFRTVVDSPAVARELLRVRLGRLDHEVFAVLLLDAQHRLIDLVELFRGTLTQTSVYPREVVKLALAQNAACVILAHNHPSGVPEPSRADEHLTQTLKSALALVDVRVLDHVVVAAGSTVSMAERGLV